MQTQRTSMRGTDNEITYSLNNTIVSSSRNGMEPPICSVWPCTAAWLRVRERTIIFSLLHIFTTLHLQFLPCIHKASQSKNTDLGPGPPGPFNLTHYDLKRQD